MKAALTLILILIFSTFLFSAENREIPILKEKKIVFTDEEIKFIKQLNSKGVLRVAQTVNWDTYFPQNNGTIKGFHYNFVKEFATLLGVKLKVTSFEEWDTFFIRKGKELEKVKNDPNYSYSPELFDTNDIFAVGITVLPWREKMFEIVKLIPTKQMLILKKESEIKSIEDLNGKSIAVVKGTSMETNLLKLKNEKKINLNIIYCEKLEDCEKYVSQQKSDATVHDSDNAFISIKNYKDLTVAFPISNMEVMGWGVEKGNYNLKSILEKYFKFAKESGIMDKYWRESYGISFSEYVNVVDYSKK